MFAIKHINKLKTKNIFIIDLKDIFAQDMNRLTSAIKNKLSKISNIISEATNHLGQQTNLSKFSSLIILRTNLTLLYASRFLDFLDKNNTKAIVLGDVYHHFSEINFLCGVLSKKPVIGVNTLVCI